MYLATGSDCLRVDPTPYILAEGPQVCTAVTDTRFKFDQHHTPPAGQELRVNPIEPACTRLGDKDCGQSLAAPQRPISGNS